MSRLIVARYPSHSLSTGALSALVHALFLALLFFGLQWQTHTPQPVQAELWAGLPPIPKVVTETAPEPRLPEPVPSHPDPVPKVEPVKPVPPSPASSAVSKPDIVTERARNAKILAEKKAEEEQHEIERKKTQQELKLREIEREQNEKREALLKEQAIKAQAQKELALKEQAEEKRLAALQREADARNAQTQASGNQQILQSYIERMQAKIKSNTIVPPSVPSGASATVKFVVLPDGSVLDGSIRVVQSSGQSAYDDAVQRAIIASQPLPLPDDLALRRQMRDVLLKTTNR